jgi:hypothetical protein
MLKAEINNGVTIAGPCHAGQNVPIVAGLPFRTAAVYVLLFAVAFGFYGVVWSSAPITESDTGGYFRVAQDLSDLHINQLHYRTPGYPLLLVLTGASRSPNRTLFFASLLLHFSSIWLLGLVLFRAGLTEMRLNLFSLILLLPPFVEPAGYVLAENLAEAMLVAAFVSFIFWHLNKRIIWILISAASIGYAALTRPTYQLLALAVTAWLVMARFLLPRAASRWRDLVQASLILISGSILIVGGYAYFNYRSFGCFCITPILGMSLTQKTVHVIERLPDEYGATREILIRARNAVLLASGGTVPDYIPNAVPELTKITGFEQPQLSNYMLKLNLMLIREAPLNYLREVFWAFGTYWLPSSSELANFNSRSVQLLWGIIHFVLIGGFAFNLILLIGATTYLKRCRRFVKPRNRILNGEGRLIHFQAFLYGLAGTIVIYNAAISCLIDVGVPRHRVSTDVLIVFMLFLGTDLWRRLVDLSRTVLERAQVGTE